MTTGLENRVVIVTGAAAGIGRATAVRFAQERCRVAALDISDAASSDVLDEIARAGGQGLFVRVDVSRKESVDAAVDRVVQTWGQVDVLINNAGIVRDAQLVKWKDGQIVSSMSDETFDAVIAVNLRGVFLCTRAVVPHMLRAQRGVILSASSVVALYGNFGQTNYLAAKSGLIGMTRGWARELGRSGIRVNAVAPGFIATEILRDVPQKVLDTMIEHTPLRRMGRPDDVANAYVWLASDQASFVHGTVLSVDGGLVIGT